MSAFAFPLARQNLADLLMVETVTWHLREFQELGGLGGGEWVTRDLAPMVWEGECSTYAADQAAIEALYGRFNLLRGSIHSFYLFDPSRPYPATDPQGGALGAANVTVQSIGANRDELTMSGMPAGLTLPQGTMLSITSVVAGRTALLQTGAPITANGGLVAGPVVLSPHLRPWIVNDLPVALIKPVAKVKLVPRSLVKTQVTSVTWRLRFTARQTLAAG